MIEGTAEVPVVQSLYDITQVGYYRCNEEVVLQEDSKVAGEALKWIYDLKGDAIGQAWSDKHGVMFRRPYVAGVWGQWFIVPNEKETTDAIS